MMALSPNLFQPARWATATLLPGLAIVGLATFEWLWSSWKDLAAIMSSPSVAAAVLVCAVVIGELIAVYSPFYTGLVDGWISAAVKIWQRLVRLREIEDSLPDAKSRLYPIARERVARHAGLETKDIAWADVEVLIGHVAAGTSVYPQIERLIARSTLLERLSATASIGFYVAMLKTFDFGIAVLGRADIWCFMFASVALLRASRVLRAQARHKAFAAVAIETASQVKELRDARSRSTTKSGAGKRDLVDVSAGDE